MWRPTFQENVLSQDTPEPRQASWRRDLLLALSVLVAVFLIVFRMPDLIPGRIWAEEASYFATAYEFGWVKGLTQVHGEYVNLPANLAATAAQFLALEDAPKASLLLALLFQCLPAIVLLTLRIPWLSAPQHSVVAVLLTILTPLSEETWLNSINSQIYLTVCVGLILMARPRGGAAGFFHVAVLLMAILTHGDPQWTSSRVRRSAVPPAIPPGSLGLEMGANRCIIGRRDASGQPGASPAPRRQRA